MKSSAPAWHAVGLKAHPAGLSKALVVLWIALAAAAACAQSVSLTGIMGNRALVIVEGSPPKTLAAGETHQGVKLISTFGETAVLEIAGKRHTLRVGDAPASVGGRGGPPSGSRIVLQADTGGHFFSQGAINGRAVHFMVDTGATSVSMSIQDAERIGLNYKAG